MLEQFGVTEADTPIVACARMLLLRNPSNRELAEEIGIRRPIEQTVYDLAIVGSGPAGLAAAVYGASEGLNTVVLESNAPGGQAGSSMRIENYLGFPTGITGSDLADRAVLQADKFGARISIPTPVIKLSFDQAYSVLGLEGGETVVAKCLLIATGAEYRRLDVEGCSRFEGNGVYYAATPNEAQMCRDSDVVLVGGGNSAGQAAVYLSQNARKVFLLIRGDDLCKSMSAYLAHRIMNTPNIELLRNTTVVGMSGDGYLSSVEILNKKTGEKRTLKTPALFSFIGATPADRLAAARDRERRKEFCPDRNHPDRIASLETETPTVPARDQPSRRLRRRRRPLRLRQTRRLRRRRRLHVRPICPRIPERDVSWAGTHPANKIGRARLRRAGLARA